MEVYFGILDGREKRWFPKVARAAEQKVNQLLGSLGGQKRLKFHARFETSETDCASVVECKEGTVRYTALVFTASGWQTVKDAIPSATEQLASAVLTVLPESLRLEAANRFSTAGIQVAQVSFRKETIPTDGLADFYLYLHLPMERDAFFTLVDQIDVALQKASLGEVSGNAYSVSKLDSCVDLVSADPDNAQRTVESVLKRNNIQAYKFTAQP